MQQRLWQLITFVKLLLQDLLLLQRLHTHHTPWPGTSTHG
jgi:hypothetical protein